MSYKAHMHGGGKSSDCIVPTKCANKGGGPSAERMEGRRSAEETSRHGPMLDTAPENIGALQCRGNACSRYRLGAERSEVGTVCVKRASTGLCGGQPATAVPTATPSHALSKDRKLGGSSRSQRWAGSIIVTNVAPLEPRTPVELSPSNKLR